MTILAILRGERGYTTEQMALYLGLSSEEYVKLESNPDLMGVDLAKRICSVLRCDIDALFPIELD